ncbi:hypothetical protein [Nocardia caishijiensis]|uniref:Peptidase inhibitor family I36 n=1 Tax=Nocardia caishijiensis TaxID=184756 RepID=A0ABQ6YHX1_9NOCA|nr:hypothetical protein [Nocardia caishijiensis]KAF0845380.1 hypothetical protein FNL39_108188 [Nocardia caishijiensis]
MMKKPAAAAATAALIALSGLTAATTSATAENACDFNLCLWANPDQTGPYWAQLDSSLCNVLL